MNTTHLLVSGHYVGPENFQYVVTDENDVVVSTGISSNEDWARHDAGDYHTQSKFDTTYPDGWQVHFAWLGERFPETLPNRDADKLAGGSDVQ